MAVLVAVLAGEGDQGEVSRVQHELEAEEDHQGAAPDQHPARADREKERREDQIPGDVHYVRSPAAVGASARSASGQDHRADRGDEQEHRGRLEDDQEALQEQVADGLGGAEAERQGRPLAVERRQPGAQDRDRELDEERRGEQRGQESLAGDRLPDRLLDRAHVGGHEHVQDHHRPRVDDHLGGGDELRVQQQEEPGERHQVDDERQHAVERVSKRDHADGTGDGADRPGEEGDLHHQVAAPAAAAELLEARGPERVRLLGE